MKLGREVLKTLYQTNYKEEKYDRQRDHQIY